MAPTLTRAMAKSDPEYVFERFTPKKRNRRSSNKEENRKKQKLAREKLVASKREGLVTDDSILAHFGAAHVKGVQEFQERLNSTADRIVVLADEIESYNTLDTDISEIVRGDMEAFCGKAKLLVTSKLQKQYQKMIEDALSPTYTPPTKVSDLTGFWEMVQLQVDQVDDTYKSLMKLKENKWVETKEKVEMKKVLKPKATNKPAVTKPTVKNTELAKARAEKMKAFKADMREKARQQQQLDNDENIVPTE